MPTTANPTTDLRHRLERLAERGLSESEQELADVAADLLAGAERALAAGDARNAAASLVAAERTVARLEGLPELRRASAWEVAAVELENRDAESRHARWRARRAQPEDIVREVELRRAQGMKAEASYAEVATLYKPPLSSARVKRVYLEARRTIVERKGLCSTIEGPDT